MKKELSIYLDLIRFSCAMVVFCGHLSRHVPEFSALFPLYKLSHDAVVVFFVLSGFVIRNVAETREKTLKQYAVSRVARLYSVVVPALVVSAVLFLIGQRLYPDQYAPTTPLLFQSLVSLSFTTDLWFFSLVPFGNSPFWSLSYEFWYYLLFACFWFGGKYRWWLTLLAAGIVGIKVLLMFPLWLMGCFLYKQTLRTYSERLGWFLFLATPLAFLAYRLSSLSDLFFLNEYIVQLFGLASPKALGFSAFFLRDVPTGLLIALNFFGFNAIGHRFTSIFSRLEKFIRALSLYTFSLYILHIPVILFFKALLPKQPFLIVVITLLFVWAVGAVGERLKVSIKAALLR